jgi:hypothetical protein
MPATDEHTPNTRPDVAELGRLIAVHAPYDGIFPLRVPGVDALRRSTVNANATYAVQQASVCIVAQGAKSVAIGDSVYRYGAGQIAVFSIDLPVAAQLTHATHAEPYLTLSACAWPTAIPLRGFCLIGYYSLMRPENNRQLERAVAAAESTLALDRQIVELMSLTFDKTVAAQSQLTPAVIAALSAIQHDTQELGEVAGAIPVRDAVAELGDAVTRMLLFSAVLEWFFRTDAIELWLGFFDALLRDIASFDVGLTHVREFFDAQYEGTFGQTLRRLASEQLARVGPVVAQSLEPLRAAIGELAGSASKAMAQVFTAFDLPLLLDAPTPELRIPNANPLAKSLQSLRVAVTTLEEMLVRDIRESLTAAVAGQAKALFRALMIAHFVTPLLVALVVAILGGPIAAAVIAAIIAVGLQELLHLLVRLLLGPLREQLDALAATTTAAFRVLQRAIVNETPVSALSAPADYLCLTRDELRQLSDLLPQAFLEDAATLLGDARSRLLDGARVHALAAERAAGFESASAFDRVRYTYRSALTPAPQLPGGTDENLFAGAALLRDLGALDTDRIRVADGREVTLTRRLSLFRLLGGTGDPVKAAGVQLGRFADFLETGRTAIELVPDALLDGTAPGMYRALIDRIELSVIARLPLAETAFAATGVVATLTHSGTSSTRIRRTGNRNAPPIDLPRDFPDREAYVLATTFKAAAGFPFPPNTVNAMAWSIIVNMTEAKTWQNVQRECARQLPAAVASLGNLIPAVRLEATASSFEPGHEPANAIEDTRARYFSSTFSDTAEKTEWLAVRIGESQVITGLRIWPRENKIGWPTEYAIEVSANGSDYRAVPYNVSMVSTPGEEAVYFHFAPQTATHVRIRATKLGSVGTKFALQVADFVIELMNVDVVKHDIKEVTGTHLSDHPWTNLIAGTPGTYASSPYFPSQPSPGPGFTATLAQPNFVNIFRITPVAGAPGFPTVSIALGRDNATLEPLGEYAITSAAPLDIMLPSYRSNTVVVRGTKLPSFPEKGYALQLTKIEAWSLLPRPAVIPALNVERAVAALVSAAPEPSEKSDLTFANAITAAVVDGIRDRALPGLADRDGLPGVARSTWQEAREEVIGHIAKWAGARMEDDPDPNVRGLDYVRLVQTTEPVSCSYMLVPTGNANPGATSVLLSGTGGNGGSSAAQYGPFENLGLGGVLELRIPDAAAAAVADVLLDIHVRACYDQTLASAVEASRRQQSDQLAQVAKLGPGRLLTVGAPRTGVGSAPTTTTQISLRAHRDRILQTALAGAQVASGVFNPPPGTIGGIRFDPSAVSGLAPGGPFRFFGNVTSRTISLLFARSLADTDTLAVQLPQIVLTPAMFGIDLPLLDPLLKLPHNAAPALVGLSVVLVPTHKGVLRRADGTASLAPKTGTVDPLLQPLLPSEWKTPGTPVPSLITMTTPPSDGAPPEVALSSLWAPDARRGLTIDFGDAIAGDLLYDVIVGITLREAVLTAVTTRSGTL